MDRVQNSGRSARSLKLRKTIVAMLRDGRKPREIRWEILTADCGDAEKVELLRELHLEMG